RAAVGRQQSAREADGRRLASAVGTDQTEHLARTDVEGEAVQRGHRAVPARDAGKGDRRRGHFADPGSSASTGMPGLSTPSRLSAVTLMRYTSFERSSAVCTLRGVNSAFGEMNVIVPGSRCPASVTSATA